MTITPLDIDTMPRVGVTGLRSKWAAVTRQVRQSGSVAVTRRGKVEMVLVEADLYRRMTGRIPAKHLLRDQAILDELTRRFDADLAVLQQPDARDKIQAVLDAGGKFKNRPKAGTTY
jgi:hypothetical protein